MGRVRRVPAARAPASQGRAGPVPRAARAHLGGLAPTAITPALRAVCTARAPRALMVSAHARQTLGGMARRARCVRRTTLVRCASRVRFATMGHAPITSATATSSGPTKTAAPASKAVTGLIARTDAPRVRTTAPATKVPTATARATRDGKGLNVHRVYLATTAQNAFHALQQVAPLRAMEQHAKTMVCAAWTLKETRFVFASLATTGRSARSPSGAVQVIRLALMVAFVIRQRLAPRTSDAFATQRLLGRAARCWLTRRWISPQPS